MPDVEIKVGGLRSCDPTRPEHHHPECPGGSVFPRGPELADVARVTIAQHHVDQPAVVGESASQRTRTCWPSP